MPAATTEKLKIIQALNIVSIILVLSAHAYFVISYGGLYLYFTYLNPPTEFVGIFLFVLYSLQFGYALYGQFYSDARIVQDIVENVIGYLFVLSNLLWLGWLYFMNTRYFIVSGIFILLHLISTSSAQRRLILNYAPNNDSTPKVIILLTHVPFSMFSAYSLLSLFRNGSVIFHFGTEFATVLVWIMAIAGFAWCLTGVFSYERIDPVFSVTITWLLFGIGIKAQYWSASNLSTTCTVLAFTQIIVLCLVLYKSRTIFISTNNNESGERRGLLFSRPLNFYGTNMLLVV